MLVVLLQTMIVTVPHFYGEGKVVHAVRWTGKESYRGRGKARQTGHELGGKSVE